MAKKKKISHVGIAFGGGGSHSAAHAGAMSVLFNYIQFKNAPSFSGTSGGAITAVTAAIGFKKNKEQGVIDSLDKLWEQLGKEGLYFSEFAAHTLRASGFFQTMEFTAKYLESQASITEDILPNYVGDFFAKTNRSVFNLNGGFDRWFRGFYNPLLINHLKHFVKKHISFNDLKSESAPDVFVNAFDIKAQRGILFKNDEINEHTLSASGTLPFLWKPVRYKGKKLIDGKYHANPPIRVLNNNGCKEIFIISLSTLEKDQYLLRELAHLKSELTTQRSKPKIHLIEMDLDGDFLTKMNSNPDHVEKLIRHGSEKMETWLKKNHSHLGKKSTIDWARIPNNIPKIKRKISL